MRRFVAVALASVVAVACGTIGSPQPTATSKATSTLFALGEKGAVLLSIDVASGTTSRVGPTGRSPQVLALAIARDGATAYSIANAQDAASAQLAKIDLKTGATTLVGKPLGQSLYVMGMTFSPEGTLYAAGDFDPASPTFNSLYTVDLDTGAAKRVGPIAVGSDKMKSFVMSFSFDPHGALYGASTTALYKIDPKTATGTKVVDFSGAAGIMGIAFDGQGTLYAADFVDQPGTKIYKVNLETGALTAATETHTAFVHNIAFAR